MEQATILYENELKNFVMSLILDIMAISDTGLKEKKRENINENIRVLVVNLAEQDEKKLISMDSYYSDDKNTEIEEIRGCFDEIKNADKKLKELSIFGSYEDKKCTKSEHINEAGKKEVMVQCLLLKEMTNYFGVIQYALDEMVDQEKKINEVKDKLKNKELKESYRTILMEKYVQRFLKKNNLPKAEFLIALSAQRYEGSESKADIYIDGRGADNTELSYVFAEYGKKQRKLQNENLRTIRKLIEMSKRRKFDLLANDTMYIVGLMPKQEDENTFKTDQIKKCIRFNGYMDWSILINGKEEVCYKRGRYFVNSSGSDDIYDMKVQAFENEYGAIIEKANPNIMQKLRGLTDILRKQNHGTTAILTDDTEEVKRLCRADRGILIEPDKSDKFDEEELLSVTDIDGALFMDLNGACLAFGVIVDGAAAGSGNPGRGARYNCIHSYIEGKKGDTKNLYIALIFSEDGGVDILCNWQD